MDGRLFFSGLLGYVRRCFASRLTTFSVRQIAPRSKRFLGFLFINSTKFVPEELLSWF